MAVSQPPKAHHTPLPMLTARKRSRSSISVSTMPHKWIDEEVYVTKILSLSPSRTESEVDENLQRSARELGLLPVQSTSPTDVVASSLSANIIASENHQGSITSQDTAPTSCASSDRRPSTSLSNSSRIGPKFDMPSIVTELESKRHSGFKNGLRKMTGLRKKKNSGSSTPSMVSIRSHMTGTIANGLGHSPSKGPASITSGESFSSHDYPPMNHVSEPEVLVDEQALQRSLECEQLVRTRTQQLEEKRRFLEYQTRLIKELLAEREESKAKKCVAFEKCLAEQEEKNEKAVEALEARQLEDELRQAKEHEGEKRAIQTRLKHMEAYCRTPSPPTSPTQQSFDIRSSIDSAVSVPERHVTQQHYENLAQAYHVRDNMDDLHASKINVLRGKQKRTLQNFMLKKEREIEQMEKDLEKELDSINLEYSKHEAELRQEFTLKRHRLEARWKLQALIEKTRMERSTGVKYEGLPDVVATEA